jgi:F0F1-type ATP synthase assembly protein I
VNWLEQSTFLLLRLEPTTPKNRCIVVEIHVFDRYPIAIAKFFDKAHRFSSNRYSLFSSSGEAAQIIRTAIEIMLSFYHLNRLMSFAFMGAT